MTTWLVAGGAGFIGRRFVERLLADGERVVVLDAFTYAAHPAALDALACEALEVLTGRVDSAADVATAMEREPEVVVNFAAESHVDRSLKDPGPFMSTNATGAWLLASAVRERGGRLVQVSTDEVYGDLNGREAAREHDAVRPSNPYAASKACGDALVLSLFRAHRLDVVVTRGANTYGPGQFPEKLLPLAARRWAEGQPMPLYGDGFHVRDWLHVDDHVAGILAAARKGEPGRAYHLGSRDGRTNREVLMLWRKALGLEGHSTDYLESVPDRPGHDRRYALADGWTREVLGWAPAVRFEDGLVTTANWLLDHPGYWDEALARPDVVAWFAEQYGEG